MFARTRSALIAGSSSSSSSMGTRAKEGSYLTAFALLVIFGSADLTLAALGALRFALGGFARTSASCLRCSGQGPALRFLEATHSSQLLHTACTTASADSSIASASSSSLTSSSVSPPPSAVAAAALAAAAAAAAEAVAAAASASAFISSSESSFFTRRGRARPSSTSPFLSKRFRLEPSTQWFPCHSQSGRSFATVVSWRSA
mmetsp:Transcript_4385/g.10589  ORF Transcript_4385/g.10589 Transcript_4385/m.10589 type:complete len:203 (+) Transcript_4385:2223-2831(+)